MELGCAFNPSAPVGHFCLSVIFMEAPLDPVPVLAQNSALLLWADFLHL